MSTVQRTSCEEESLIPTTLASVEVMPTQTVSRGREILADLMVGFGAANLAYIVHWSHLLTVGQSDLFWRESSPLPVRYAAIIS